MLRKICVTALLGAGLGCPSHAPVVSKPAAAGDRALRVQIANAEAKRAAGVGELIELVHHGDPHAKELALRGLGRIGGDDARAALIAALHDPATADAAAGALGVMAALDDVTVPELAQAEPSPDVIEALGRAGDASVEPELVGYGGPGDLALGRFGRRKIGLMADLREALVAHTKLTERDARYAATYALSREYQPPSDDLTITALVERVSDSDPEIRALAIAALGRRKAVDRARSQLLAALRDPDWRVAVEAFRAIDDDAGPDAYVAIELAKKRLLEGAAGNTQVLVEGLRTLALHRSHFRTQAPNDVAPLVKAWIDCIQEPEGCSELPEHVLAQWRVEWLKASKTPFAGSLKWLHEMLGSSDPRVRGAGLAMLPILWPNADDDDHRTYVAQIAAALGASDVVLAGAAVDAAGSLYELKADTAPIDAALVARAKREQDVELSADLYALIGKQHLAAGADACRGGLQAPPVRARAAAECLRALGEATPTPPIGAATPPPVDVTAVIGRELTWRLQTTRGEIAIHLRPDIAPWNVATIVALTQKHFYDGTEFHRVVPGFVVQGGDPTGSGAGGPGFTTPAEPAPGAWFKTGAVGIADAGRDSGGSQFFIMHATAPHLDGRYTYIGDVISGQNVADSLLIGDEVLSATISAK